MRLIDRRRVLLLAGVVLVALACSRVVAAEAPVLRETLRVDPEHRTRVEKLLVLAITDDLATRRAFEDRFVTHLRSRRLDGVPSWKISEGLEEQADKERIFLTLTERHVDSVITIRPVPLEKGAEAESAWTTRWKEAWSDDMTVRRLIDETLPPPKKQPKRVGMEITLWDLNTRGRLWSGRIDAAPLRDLRKASTDLVRQVIDALSDDGFI